MKLSLNSIGTVFSHFAFAGMIAWLIGIALTPAQAQSSFYRRFGGGDGCPFCQGPRGGRFDDPNMPPPAHRPDNETTPNAPIPVPPALPAPVVTAPTITAAMASAAANQPTVTKEQAAAFAAQSSTVRADLSFKKAPDGYWSVDFGQLASFVFDLPVPGAAPTPGSVDRIPAPLRKLDGQRVRLSGFMLPIRVAGGVTTEFLIVRSPLVCCYGVTPAPNEWVCVKMIGQGVPMQMDTPLQFSGTLHVGEIFENNFFVGLYRLDADKVSVN